MFDTGLTLINYITKGILSIYCLITKLTIDGEFGALGDRKLKFKLRVRYEALSLV